MSCALSIKKHNRCTTIYCKFSCVLSGFDVYWYSSLGSKSRTVVYVSWVPPFWVSYRVMIAHRSMRYYTIEKMGLLELASNLI